MNLLLQEQATFDTLAFDRDTWNVADRRVQKTRHVGLHLAKASLKLVSGYRDIIADEVIPDLSIYRAQLINTHEFDPEIAGPLDWHLADDNAAIRGLTRVSGNLAYYLEPAEHGANVESLRVYRVSQAVADLHLVVESLGQIYGVDVETAHEERLDYLIGADY